jgi:hypothetical protein
MPRRHRHQCLAIPAIGVAAAALLLSGASAPAPTPAPLSVRQGADSAADERAARAIVARLVGEWARWDDGWVVTYRRR